MKSNSYIEEYYNTYNEDGRLKDTNHGKVEYLTTMKYVHQYLQKGMTVLEVGAATGRYSVALAHEGYHVYALDLVESNLNKLKSKITAQDYIVAEQGNALDLSRYSDEMFDITLLLGPMYHLYNESDKLIALKEALRVTKKGGILFIAYCMNEPTIWEYCFKSHKIKECLEKKMLTEDFHCISTPADLFELVRVEDIDHLNEQVNVERIHLIATDGHTSCMREVIDEMDEETFAIYIKHHLTICERQDLIGASDHTLDILRKR